MYFPVGRYTPDTDYSRVLEGCRYLDYMGKTEVRLVVPGLPTRGSVRVRLDRKTRTKCPLGKVECSVNGNTVAHFNCKEVIEYLSIKLGVQRERVE